MNRNKKNKKKKIIILILVIAIEILIISYLLLTELIGLNFDELVLELSLNEKDCVSEDVFSTPTSYVKTMPNFNCPGYSFLMPLENSSLLNVLIPNYSNCYDGFRTKIPLTVIKINSDGFRDREYSLEKHKDTIRIVALGDSFTFPDGVNVSDGWPKIVESLLNLNSSLNYEVMNLGVPSYDFKEYVDFFKLKGMKYNPDIVIIATICNDIIDEREREEVIESKINKLITSNTDYEEYNRLQTIIALEYDRELWKNLTNNFDYYFNKSAVYALNKLYNLTKDKGSKILIVNFCHPIQYLYERTKNEYNFKNFYVVDFLPEFVNEAKNRGYCKKDLVLDELDTHPNRLSHHIFGELIYKYLLKAGLIT